MKRFHIVNRLFSTLIGGLLTIPCLAQQKAEIDFQTDIVSQNIFRGQDQGDVSIQPVLSAAWKGLELEVEGSVGLSNSKDCKQIDMTLSYNIGKFKFGVVNYWDDEPKEPYFYFGDNSGHQFEGFVAYDFGVLSASWGTLFAGSDARNSKNKRVYSSYLELTAPFKLCGLDCDAQVGIVPWETDYYNTTGFAVTNLALNISKDVRITDSFSLPLFASLISNPSTRDLFFVGGLSFKIF